MIVIDINGNFLTKMDCNSRDWFWKLKVLKKAEQRGITHIVSTPHFNKEYLLSNKEHLLEVISELNENVKKEGINIKILAGHQVLIYEDLVKDYIKNSVLSLNNNHQYIFISLPPTDIPLYTHRVIFELQMIGLKPIIVLPERNTAIVENPNLLYQLVWKGAFTQVGAASITGEFGKKTQKLALQFIAQQLTHFIATDEDEYDDLIQSYKKIHHKFGADTRYKMLENAKKLADNRMVTGEEPVKLKRKKWWNMGTSL
ncbi:tyrosine-protein phosphatase [Chengkuizengella sediminis]|uniref:tyrosine-protein phosphatase n=1 Tax=Chengkuizengella sediminis TaxID=1885917 RepID=UPI00138A41D8|nr:CpsB/CapC family capsule biosynthesis tyrosine phosphatase [Chengkuizengella sediminis]NDI35191.1 tyrosine protein phosphatase [Chengkuizengella sediminis]